MGEKISVKGERKKVRNKERFSCFLAAGQSLQSPTPSHIKLTYAYNVYASRMYVYSACI